MDELVWEKNRKGKMEIGRWLFNPFYYVAGVKALIIGLNVLVLTGIFACYSNARFDGLLDFHMALPPVPLWINIAEVLFSWLLFSILLLLAGRVISKSRPRCVDVFGTQALARFPYLFVSLAALIPGTRRFARELVAGRASLAHFSADMAAFLFIVVLGLLMLIWMIVLMYRAYSVSCNVSGKAAISTFIVALIGGELISKVMLWRVFPI
jgi:hypothetical protein